MAVFLTVLQPHDPHYEHHRLLCGSDAYIVAAGRGMLMSHLKLRKMLVVIDDVDDVTQIKNLLPPCELHPQSLVIVTSRKRNILEARCTFVSKVQLMPKGHDMQLFEAWAFAAGQPVWDTSVLIQEVVACCGRLPLTLKVGLAQCMILVASTQVCDNGYDIGRLCVNGK